MSVLVLFIMREMCKVVRVGDGKKRRCCGLKSIAKLSVEPTPGKAKTTVHTTIDKF